MGGMAHMKWDGSFLTESKILFFYIFSIKGAYFFNQGCCNIILLQINAMPPSGSIIQANKSMYCPYMNKGLLFKKKLKPKCQTNFQLKNYM